MRVIQFYGYEITLTDGKPYSVINFNYELKWGVSDEEQEHIMFTPEGLLDYYDIYNSGQRFLSVKLNSVEEMFHVCSILQDHGFKAKPSYVNLEGHENRYYLDPETFEYNQDIELGKIPSLALPGEYGIFMMLYRKDFKKFLRVLDELRDEHNYRTLYVGKDRVTEYKAIIK